MTDFDSTKAEFAASVERLISERATGSENSLLDVWIKALSRTGITALRFSFDPRDLDDDYADDEIVFSKTFFFYESGYLRECCAPGDDCLAGKHCIPIGGVNGADEFIYISDNLKLGIALLHRDDVFSASDLDMKVKKTSSRLRVSLARFLNHLTPQTTLVRFGATHNASKWLILENLGTRVRYQINLPGKSEEGEEAFHSPLEAEAFFFKLIQQGCLRTPLSLLYCPDNLRQRIEEMLRS